MTARRDFDALSEAQIAAGRMRGRWVEPTAAFRPGAPRAVADLIDTIQHVAEAATGERSFLHLGPGRRASSAGAGTAPARALGSAR